MRFSVVSVLLVVSYVAVVLAAIAYPLSNWIEVNLYIWLVILVYMAIEACAPYSRQSALARGMLCGCIAYLLACFVDHVVTELFGSNLSLAHNQLYALFFYIHGGEEGEYQAMPYDTKVAFASRLAFVALIITSVASSILGGVAGGLRYRHQGLKKVSGTNGT